MLRKAKILLADRNRHVREFLQREFVREGYQVQIAKDGLELWHLLQEDEPADVLILDVEIPYLDPATLYKHLRERQPTLPIIIHTFFPEEATDLGFQPAALVEKAENPQLLKSVVQALLAK